MATYLPGNICPLAGGRLCTFTQPTWIYSNGTVLFPCFLKLVCRAFSCLIKMHNLPSITPLLNQTAFQRHPQWLAYVCTWALKTFSCKALPGRSSHRQYWCSEGASTLPASMPRSLLDTWDLSTFTPQWPSSFLSWLSGFSYKALHSASKPLAWLPMPSLILSLFY